MVEKVYARVQNDRIIEFPVLETHITSRNHPIAWYTLCKFTVKPDIGEFQQVAQIPNYVNGEVHITYKVSDLSLQFMLSRVAKKNETTGILEANDIKSIDPRYLLQIEKLCTEHAQSKLDAFARERGYDDSKSAITYEFSGNEKFAKEAAKVKSVRDSLWTGFYAYLDNVKNATVPFPLTVSEIDQHIPEMKWE